MCSSTECQGQRLGGKTFLKNLMPHSRDVFSNLIRIASPSQSCHRTVPEACELIASTEIETDLGVILGPGAGVGRRKHVSWSRSGLPGAGKRARTSGLQRIGWILSKTHGYEPVAQNGLGLGLGAYRAVQSAWPNIPRRAAAAPQLLGRSQPLR